MSTSGEANGDDTSLSKEPCDSSSYTLSIDQSSSDGTNWTNTVSLNNNNETAQLSSTISIEQSISEDSNSDTNWTDTVSFEDSVEDTIIGIRV